MLNFWNTSALVYLLIMLFGTAFILSDNNDFHEPLWVLNAKIFIGNVVAYMWTFSLIVFPVLLILGGCASSGKIWGLIQIN